MDEADFREIALGLTGAEEGAHMGCADFRVGGRIFATLASKEQGYGNLMLTPELQTRLISEAPDLFLPVHGGWGRMGATHIRLAEATEYQLTNALTMAWNLRIEKNQKTRVTKKRPAETSIKKATAKKKSVSKKASKKKMS